MNFYKKTYVFRFKNICFLFLLSEKNFLRRHFFGGIASFEYKFIQQIQQFK